MHIVINSIEKNRNKNRNIFYSYIVYLNMRMLSFKVVLGYQGLLYSQTNCDFLFRFFQTDRPTQYQETHSTLNQKKKKEWPNLQRGHFISKLCYFYTNLSPLNESVQSFPKNWQSTSICDRIYWRVCKMPKSFFFFSWTSIQSFRIQLQKRIANILRIKWDEISAIKFEEERLDFLTDVAVPVVVVWDSYH